jgi:chemotaxis family two-component system response regulator Rcp1
MREHHPVPVHILLVEDSPGDVNLTIEALRDARVANELHIVGDGEEAMAFVRGEAPHENAPRRDLILLDLNLPLKDGREVLAELKSDPALATIPVIVLTTSSSEADVLRSYELHANSYVTKPVDFAEFIATLRGFEGFWLSIVRLPPKTD